MTQSSPPARLPYGISSFAEIRARNMLYVDKTHVIEQLEKLDSPYVLFLRPRRFGKTLLSSMLCSYYDKTAQWQFDELFAHTYIHSHRSDLQGTFYVLNLDFSGISPANAVAGVTERIVRSISDFYSRYAFASIQPLLDKEWDDPAQLITAFFSRIAPLIGRRVYVIIDEYDQFANEVLASDKSQFRLMTSQAGFLKAFYAALKSETGNGVVSRIFITGVTAVTLDSVTSGFNIQTNISEDARFCEAAGFTESELRTLMQQALDKRLTCEQIEAVMAQLKDYYNGYHFSPRSHTSVYNPSMCLHFLRHVLNTGEAPICLFDPAVGADRSKIRSIFDLAPHPWVKAIVQNTIANEPLPLPTGALSSCINLNNLQQLGQTEVLSLLFYMGFLTYSSSQPWHLCCPNKAMMSQFTECFFELIDTQTPQFSPHLLQAHFHALANGDIEPFLTYFAKQLKLTSGLHLLAHLNETALQVALKMALLSNADFEVRLEEEARGTGYCDVLLVAKHPRSQTNSYLIEMKYLPKKAHKNEIASVRAQAMDQLMRYSESANIQALHRVKCVAVVFCGLELVCVDVHDPKHP